MKIGLIGLGRMGLSIAQRAIEGGHEVVGFDYSPQACAAAQESGAVIVDSAASVADHARVIWLMVPAGDPVDQVLATLTPLMSAGSIIVDGGNSKFTDSIRRAANLASQNIMFVDCGTSGGLHGREVGFSLMIGGNAQAYAQLEPLFASLAAPGGYGHVGPSGAGHYVKMVHNGIEYGLMQAYAEGFHLLKEGNFKESHLDLAQITRIWSNGSVIRSFLLDLSHDVFCHDQQLADVSGEVNESGMGAWTVEDAHKNSVPVEVIETSLDIRAQSRITGGNYGTKVVALLRKAFGGHFVKKVTQ